MKQQKGTSEAARKMAKAKHAKLTAEERSENARKMRQAALHRAAEKEKFLVLFFRMWEKMAPEEREKVFPAQLIKQFQAILKTGWQGEAKKHG